MSVSFGGPSAARAVVVASVAAIAAAAGLSFLAAQSARMAKQRRAQLQEMARQRARRPRGHDSKVLLKVTFEEAMTGATRKTTYQITDADGNSVVKTASLAIPGGVTDGYALLLPGQGSASSQGTGDLIAEVLLEEHDIFYRDETAPEHAHLEVTVTRQQAEQGAALVVPSLLGDDVETDLRPGARTGDVLSLQGLGFPVLDAEDGECGHQLVHIQVEE